MNRILLPLLVLCLLAAAAARGYSADRKPEQAQPEDEAKAIAEIEKLSGEVIVDEDDPDQPVIGVDLTHTGVTDAGLVHVKAFSHLRGLCLEGTKVTDAGLADLKGLTQLQWLDLEGTKVTDAGLAHLKGLTQLQVLGLQGTKVTDAGLAHLEGLSQLQTLFLGDTKVTDAGIESLQEALPDCEINR
jgi:hypothetical protein